MPRTGIKNRLLSVAVEEQAEEKNITQPYYKAFERICQDDYKKMPQMRQKSYLPQSRAVLLRGLLSQDLRGGKRLISPKDNEQISLFTEE